MGFLSGAASMVRSSEMLGPFISSELAEWRVPSLRDVWRCYQGLIERPWLRTGPEFARGQRLVEGGEAGARLSELGPGVIVAVLRLRDEQGQRAPSLLIGQIRGHRNWCSSASSSSITSVRMPISVQLRWQQVPRPHRSRGPGQARRGWRAASLGRQASPIPVGCPSRSLRDVAAGPV